MPLGPRKIGTSDFNPSPVPPARAQAAVVWSPPPPPPEMDSRGFDSAGRVFSNATEMWAEELGSTATATTSAAAEAEAASTAAAAGNGGIEEEASGEGKRKEWYSKAIAYWQVKHPLFLL